MCWISVPQRWDEKMVLFVVSVCWFDGSTFASKLHCESVPAIMAAAEEWWTVWLDAGRLQWNHSGGCFFSSYCRPLSRSISMLQAILVSETYKNKLFSKSMVYSLVVQWYSLATGKQQKKPTTPNWPICKRDKWYLQIFLQCLAMCHTPIFYHECAGGETFYSPNL